MTRVPRPAEGDRGGGAEFGRWPGEELFLVGAPLAARRNPGDRVQRDHRKDAIAERPGTAAQVGIGSHVEQAQ